MRRHFCWYVVISIIPSFNLLLKTAIYLTPPVLLNYYQFFTVTNNIAKFITEKWQSYRKVVFTAIYIKMDKQQGPTV